MRENQVQAKGKADNASVKKSFMPNSLNYTAKSSITLAKKLNLKGNKTLRIMTLSLMTLGKETLGKITAK